MEALEQRVVGHVLENLEVRGPSLLRTADPPIYSIQGHKVTGLRRVGKRIAFGFDNDLWLVFHLMIAGRLHWSQKKKTADGGRASKKKALHLVAKFVLQELKLGVSLDAFGEHRQTKPTPKAQYGTDNGRRLIVGID